MSESQKLNEIKELIYLIFDGLIHVMMMLVIIVILKSSAYAFAFISLVFV